MDGQDSPLKTFESRKKLRTVHVSVELKLELERGEGCKGGTGYFRGGGGYFRLRR